MRRISNILMIGLAVMALTACGTSRASVPPSGGVLPPLSFTGLAGARVELRVVDHRVDPTDSAQWVARVRSDIETALRAADITVGESPDNVLDVRILNARADFELGNSNGCARLAADLLHGGGRSSATGERCVKKGNLWGYETADNVTTMAYRDALAELLSNLDAALTH